MRGDGNERNYKSTKKLVDPLLVTCQRADCIYYEGKVNTQSGRCWCSHPLKFQHQLAEDCPLYQLDWAKKASVFNK